MPFLVQPDGLNTIVGRLNERLRKLETGGISAGSAGGSPVRYVDPREPVMLRGAASGTLTIEAIHTTPQGVYNAGVWLYNSNATGNFVINLTGQSASSLTSALPFAKRSAAITSVSHTSSTATYTINLSDSSNPVAVGMTVKVTGIAPSGYSGAFIVQSVGGSSGAWTFTCANGTNATVTTSTGVAVLDGFLPLTDSTNNIGNAATFAVIVKNGSTAYYCTGIQIDGVTQTVYWTYGAPTSGIASGFDVYEIAVLRTSATGFVVLACQVPHT